MDTLESHRNAYGRSRRHDVQAVNDLLRLIENLEPDQAEEEQVNPDETRSPQLLPHGQLDFDMALDQEVNNPAETWNFPRRFAYLRPRSLRGLVQAVMFAEASGWKVRAVGTRFSFSRMAEADDCYIDMAKAHPYELKRHNQTAKLLDQSALNRLHDHADPANYFDCPAGMTVEEANYALCPDGPDDQPLLGRRRLYNMGGADQQQIAGAFSTGTHGSGGRFSAFHDMVRSILVVGTGGNIYRVEPSRGITDPAKHEAEYREMAAIDRVKLVQDDGKFYALLVSMGCFGVIHSAILEVAPMVNLHKDARYYKSRWNKHTKASIARYQLPEEGEEMVSFLINPYRLARRKYRSFLLKTHRPTKRPARHRRERNKRFWPSVFTKLNLTVALIRMLLNDGRLPKRRLIEGSLRSQDDHKGNKGRGYTDLSYRVLQAGAGKLVTIGTGIEFAFPQEDVCEVMDLVFEHLEQQADKKRGYYVNGPVALRYVRPSEAFLAPNYKMHQGREVRMWCFVEITRVNSRDPEDDKREKELFQHLQRMMEAKGGRPHWGLNFEEAFSKEKLSAWYPKFDQWVEAFHFFNKTGTFDNPFVRNLGLRVSP